jgi:hypothetical protein
MNAIASTLIGTLTLTVALGAQTAPAAPPPKPQAPSVQGKPAPAEPASPVDAPNVRLELRITDNYSGTPTEKTVSMLVLSGRQGRVRTSNMVPSDRPELQGIVHNDPNFGRELVQLNVDAFATVVSQGHVQAHVTFEYRPAPAPGQAGPRFLPSTLNESLHIMLKSGQPLVVSQSADPTTDRKVTVELTATILK